MSGAGDRKAARTSADGGTSSTVRREAHSDYPAAALCALLMDGSTWPAWTMFTGFRREQEGSSDPTGVGSNAE